MSLCTFTLDILRAHEFGTTQGKMLRDQLMEKSVLRIWEQLVFKRKTNI